MNKVALINTMSRIVTLVSGVVVILDYFVKLPLLNGFASELVSWIPIIASFGLVAGSVDLFANNINDIIKRRGRWINNLVCVAFIIISTTRFSSCVQQPCVLFPDISWLLLVTVHLG